MKYNPFFSCPCTDEWLQAQYPPREVGLCAAQRFIFWWGYFKVSGVLVETRWEGGKHERNAKSFSIQAVGEGKDLFCMFLTLDLFKRSSGGNKDKTMTRICCHFNTSSLRSWPKSEWKKWEVTRWEFDLGKCLQSNNMEVKESKIERPTEREGDGWRVKKREGSPQQRRTKWRIGLHATGRCNCKGALTEKAKRLFPDSAQKYYPPPNNLYEWSSRWGKKKKKRNQLILKSSHGVSCRSLGLSVQPCLISRLESREGWERWVAWLLPSVGVHNYLSTAVKNKHRHIRKSNA